MKGLHHIC